MLESPMTREDLIAECKRRYAAGEGIEKLIEFLRGVDCSKIDSIAVIAVGCGIGLAKAKEAVHFSPVWTDVRASDDSFHELIEATMSANRQKHSV
jgi:hypothetical protein